MIIKINHFNILIKNIVFTLNKHLLNKHFQLNRMFSKDGNRFSICSVAKINKNIYINSIGTETLYFRVMTSKKFSPVSSSTEVYCYTRILKVKYTEKNLCF